MKSEDVVAPDTLESQLTAAAPTHQGLRDAFTEMRAAPPQNGRWTSWTQ